MASKITIKRSLTAAAPAGLSFGEMAFVQGSGNTAEQLYVGISGGNPVWVGARVENTVTDWDSKTRLATQFATVAKINSLITSNTAGVASFNGATGAVTGVSSFNGLTGAVSGVTTSVANTFTAVNTFSAGITVGGNLNAVNINTTGSVSINNGPATLTTTTAGNATVFNSVATSLGIGGAATAITMGSNAPNGTLSLRNPTIIVGGPYNSGVSTITTTSVGNTLAMSPYGSFSISPTSTTSNGGDRTSLIVTNPDDAAGTVSIRGGDLYLGTKTSALPSTTPVNIVFEGTTDNGFETTLTVTDPATADRTITLPDASGTVALTQTSVASFNGATGAVTGVSSFNGLTGAVTGITAGGINTFTQLNTFSAGISSNGGTFGTPTQLVGTNITGTASGLIAGTVTTNANLTGAITSIGNGTTLGSFNSSQLATAVTDETGTGSLVFATNPTLSGVTLGAATATTINNVAFTRPNSTATLTLYTGSSLTTRGTFDSQLEFTGTTDVTFPVSGTLSTLARIETLSNKTLSGVTLGTPLSGNLTNCTFPTLNQNTTGSAAKLTTPVNINGTAFDGSANVTVTAAANTLTGATLASNVLTSSLTSVGTLGSLSITGDLTVGGTFTVNGTVTTINSTTLTVDDKNIELGSVAVPDNTTAADGGITLKGATDKTLKWLNSGAFAWTSSENFDLVSTKAYYIAGASVLNATTLGTLVVNSSLTSVGILTSLTVSGTLEAGLIDCGTF